MKIIKDHSGKVLLISSFASLGFIQIVDRFFFNALGGSGSTFSIIGDLRISSLFILIATYLWLKGIFDFKSAFKPELLKRSIIVGSIWLVMTGYFVLFKRVWVPNLSDWIDFVSFMVLGLIAEEILFRGIIFDLAKAKFKDRMFLSFSFPVLLSSVLFGLQHLSYHAFKLTPASITQVTYTIFMGLVFGLIRESTGRLWPIILFHMMNNVFTVLRNLGF